MSPVTAMSENLPAQGLLPMELASMSSAGAFPARILAQRDAKRELRKTLEADFGPKSYVWLANFDQNSFVWRTSQICLEALLNGQGDGLAEYSETWPSSGLMRNGKTYQRQHWALLIVENESGLFPTPLKNEAGKSEHTLNLVKSGKSQMTLDRFVRLWPTPTKRDWKGGRKPETLKASGRGFSNTLGDALTTIGEFGQLNPEWVEWLMGFPTGHTELPLSETQSSPK
jgi:hypothetical protein